jgi:hypothetical protein
MGRGGGTCEEGPGGEGPGGGSTTGALCTRFTLVTLMVGEDEVPFRVMGGEEPFLVPHYLLFAFWSLGKELKKRCILMCSECK